MNFFLEHNILKVLFIEIHKFKKKKILGEDEDESNDQQSDAEQTGNGENVKDTLFPFLECSRNCTVPSEGYIGSERRTTGVTDQHAANRETSVKVITKSSMFWSKKSQSSRLLLLSTSSFVCKKLYIVSSINQYQLYPEQLFSTRCKTLTAITRY